MNDENRPSSMEQCINDITECPICNEELQDNRCLPCLHMFCLKCLKLYIRRKPKEKPLPCPVCRREFYIPKSVVELPRNFFIDKLLDAKTIKKEDVLPKLCEICSENSDAAFKSRFTINNASDYSGAARATRFCCDCGQYMCLSCEMQHKKIKATTWHKIVDSTSVTDSHELTPRPTYCITHKTKEAELYCRDCKMVICWQCKALSHSNHDSLDVSNATKDLAAMLEEQIEQIAKHLQKTNVQILKLNEDEKLYRGEIDVESDAVSKEQRKLIRNITDNGDSLIRALTSSTAIHLNTFSELRRKLESDADELKKHKVYIEQMIHLGNVSDLCEYRDVLASKTNRLTEEHDFRIIIPPVTHLSEADLHDLLTGKRTDNDLQYCNRHTGDADISNDIKVHLKDDLPPTDRSTRTLKGFAAIFGASQTVSLPFIRDRRERPTCVTDHFFQTNENISKAPSSRQMKDIADESNDNKSKSLDQQSPTTQSPGCFKDIADESNDNNSTSLDQQSPTIQSQASFQRNAFTASDISDTSDDNKCQSHDQQSPTIQSPGSFKDEDSSKYKDLSLIRTIPHEQNGTVCGITVFHSMLYVISQDSNTISVYSENAFLLINKLTVDGLVNPNDIVSCKFNNFLYICDWGRSARIFRVKDRVGMEQMNWSTDGEFGCLSVTTDHTILLAGYKSSKLKEYKSDGELLRSIDLRDDLKPWHAIRLGGSSTNYLICQGDNDSAFHRVCFIDLNGKTTRTFGGVKGFDEKHMCGPYHLAVDKSGCILVNDCNNGRVLLLSQDLKFIKEIIPSVAKVLRRARRIHLDEVAGRLYVADNAITNTPIKDGKILVFSNIYGNLS